MWSWYRYCVSGNWKAQLAKLDSPTQAQIDALKAQWDKDNAAVLALTR